MIHAFAATPTQKPSRQLSIAASGADAKTSGRLERLQRLANVMDDQFRLPGTNLRFGLDALIGLAPGIGDAVSSLISIVFVVEAWRSGLPASKLLRMGVNIGLDFILGSLPVVGDIFDFAWKANRKNIRLLRRHLAEKNSIDR